MAAAGQSDGDFSDFFASLFGQRSPFGQRGASFGGGQGGGRGRGGFAAAGDDHVAKIQIDLEDAFRGGTQTIELKAPQLGEDGRVTVQPRTLKVTIPAGVIEGQRIRLAGQGSPGIGGGPPGDLYLEIGFKPHRLFAVDGRDLTLTLPIAPWEAALGATVQTPTLAGPVDLRIPPNAKAGQKMRLKGRGLPGATLGDQYVVLKLVQPPADTPRARELYEQMQRELPFDPRSEWSPVTSDSVRAVEQVRDAARNRQVHVLLLDEIRRAFAHRSRRRHARPFPRRARSPAAKSPRSAAVAAARAPTCRAATCR